jgi:hypothetical protein
MRGSIHFAGLPIGHGLGFGSSSSPTGMERTTYRLGLPLLREALAWFECWKSATNESSKGGFGADAYANNYCALHNNY